jgi:hypothetical protein
MRIDIPQSENLTLNARSTRDFLRETMVRNGIPVPHPLDSYDYPGGLPAARDCHGEADSHRRLWQVKETISRFFAWAVAGGPGERAGGHPGTDDSGNDDGVILKWEVLEMGQKLAFEVFDVLAAAEAKVHGTTPDRVNFHEVGDPGNIVDVCCCVLMASVMKGGPWRAEFGYNIPLLTGSGTVKCAHGELPLPAPATRAILETHHLAWEHGDSGMELVTPTGAALIAVLTRDEQV